MNNAIVKRYPLANSFPILLIVCLILEQGYGLLPIPRYLFIVLVGVFFFYYKKGTSYSKPISIFVVSCFLSILSCMYFRNESPVSIMGEYNIYLMIVFYFVLCKYNVSIEVLEKVLFWAFIIFCFCYLYQVSVYPKLVFLDKNNQYNETIDVLNRRIRMVGMSINSLGYFYTLNKILEKKMNYILPMLLSLICMLLFGFRTLLFFSAVFSIIMIIRFNGFSKKLVLWCALGGLGAYLLYLTPIFQTVFEGMMERQESDQTFGNKDYIRYATLFHYYGHHYKSTVEMFLGSGLCNRALRTSYSLEILRNESYGLHYYDWGLLGISWMTGVLSLIGMLWWSLKAAFAKLPKKYLYLSVWFGYILTCAFTSAEFVRQGCFLIQAICLYLIYKISLYEKNRYNE